MFNLVSFPRDTWSIFDELESLQSDINRVFSGRVRSGQHGMRHTYPPMNVWSSDQGVVLDAELPGIDPKDVDISVVGDEFSLTGRLAAETETEGATWHRRERPYGEFSRKLQLPFRVNAADVKASYRNGVLRVGLPRAEEDKPRKIAIEAA